MSRSGDGLTRRLERIFFFQAEDGIRDLTVTGVQTCALPISPARLAQEAAAGGAGQRRLGLGQRDRGRRTAGPQARHHHGQPDLRQGLRADRAPPGPRYRSEEHTSELQSQSNLVCRLLLEKKKKTQTSRGYGS